MLNMFFGTPLERAEHAYTKHERKYNECASKAEKARSVGNYDLADRLSAEAANHTNMMNHFNKVIQRIQVDLSAIEEE